MAETVVVIVALLLNVMLAYIAVRVAWWLFRTVVSGTGKAWRGE